MHVSVSCLFSIAHILARGEAHPNLDERDPHRIKRSHESFVVKDHFIETTIVTDESMSDHHGTQNLRPYLFTLMNVVRAW